MKFKEQKLAQFLDVLSSGSATPGGGSVSALSGALGASLVAMVANLTIGRKKYASVEEEMKEALSEALRLRDEMQALVERDAESFDAVMAAHKMPKETDAEMNARKEKIEQATKGATEVPLAVMRKCLLGIELCLRVAKKGNQNSISDAGVASLQFMAAGKGAMLNVLINLPGIEDGEFRQKAEAEAGGINDLLESRSKEVLNLVNSSMKW